MIKRLATSAVIALALTSSVRADLPANFNWKDDAVAKVARAHPEQLDSANPEERARLIKLLLGEGKKERAAALKLLERTPSLERFRTLRALDRDNDTTVRKVHDKLEANDRAKFIGLIDDAHAAATAAGEQQLGIISDVDDTAIPTNYTPDGAYAFKDAGDFYRLLQRGTDGKGDAANLHFVSARVPALFPATRQRLKVAGVPVGSIDGNPNYIKFAFGGEDAIQESKIKNIELWLRLHPGQRFVFLGDSVQRDPEVYRWVLQNHPDQVELVLIHKAGGHDRDPKDYAGELFFDDYSQATRIVKQLGIPQPGARLPGNSINTAGLPLPDTDNSKIEKPSFFEKTKDFFKENVGSLFKKPPKTQGLAGAVGTP